MPNGHPGNSSSVTNDGSGKATDSFITIPAVGAGGGTPVPTFLDSFAQGNPPPPDDEAAPEFAPLSLTFPARAPGTTSDPLGVQLTNVGGGNLTVSSLSITGTHAGDFSLASNTCVGTQLSEGESCTINVRFRPTATGARSAQLRVVTNAVESVQIVPLSGTGSTAAAVATRSTYYSGLSAERTPVQADTPPGSSPAGGLALLIVLAGALLPFWTLRRGRDALSAEDASNGAQA